MPNWCEGKLKVRGTVENIKKFCSENLLSVDKEGNYVINFWFNSLGSIDDKRQCYIKGTRRGFVDRCYCELADYKKDDIVILFIDARFAWGISADELLEICKKYSVDMKIYAFERGMEYNQDIEIVNGEIIKDDEIHFEDYNWECIDPEIGG